MLISDKSSIFYAQNGEKGECGKHLFFTHAVSCSVTLVLDFKKYKIDHS